MLTMFWICFVLLIVGVIAHGVDSKMEPVKLVCELLLLVSFYVGAFGIAIIVLVKIVGGV